MKIQVDGIELFEMTETQKKVIKNDIAEEVFEEDMKRRLQYVLEHKYEQCFERLKKQWEPKLAKTLDAVPTDKDLFAELIFSQPEYKSKSQRETDG